MLIPRQYECAKCGGHVEKPACVAPGHKDKDSKVLYHGLHGWVCENCGHGIKVKVTLGG